MNRMRGSGAVGTVLACVAFLLGVDAACAQSPKGRTAVLPNGFVYLRDVDPSIAQDMRYAGANNFTGHPLPGYGPADCVLRRDTALALKQVQDELRARALSLKVYDCYRPQRAVDAMARWSQSVENHATRRFYPAQDKKGLFAAGWISHRSKHSAGIAVDLTLIPAGSATPTFDPRARYGNCDEADRAPDNSLDMGTGYDCFSGLSYTRNAAITAAAHVNRVQLITAMRKHGFNNYFREWWHFELRGGAPPVGYDVPIGR